MNSDKRELAELRNLVAQLTERVYRLEQRLGFQAPSEVKAEGEPAAVPSPLPLPPAGQQTTVVQPVMRVPAIPPRPDLSEAARPAGEPDLESRIGSQWLNRIGIVAMLIGVSFFLKYAFENNWIGPAGRISIGLIAGIAIVLWSERFRKAGTTVFSWSLKAVGVGTLYLSLWAACQVYQLIPSGVAFIAMVIVTAATAVMAITQNAEVLAAFALVGGFATPLLLSTGQNHEVVLFSYLMLLDVATMLFAASRPWRRLLVGAFAGTVILYVGWYAEFYSNEQLATTIAFLTAFFAMFAIAPLLVKGRTSGNSVSVAPTLILLPLFNAALYFLAVYVMLEDVSRTAVAWIAVVLAVVYLALSRQMQVRLRDGASSRLLTVLHIGLAVGFLTTAIPLQFESHWITIGWLVESAALLWAGYRGASKFVKVLAVIALALGIGRLLIFEHIRPEHLVFNIRFLLYLIAIAVVVFAAYLARRTGSDAEREVAAIAVVVVNVLALIALNLEARDYFVREIAALRTGGTFNYALYRGIDIARNFAYSAIWMIYGAVLMWIGFWRRSAFLRWQALVLLAVTIVKVFVFDTSQLERGYRIIAFIALGVLLLGVSFIYQRDWLKLSGRDQNPKEGSSAPA
jgi:uncharacterized membrane protein